MPDAVIFRYGNDGTPKGALDYESGVHEEDLDGTDRLTVVSTGTPTKNDRLVWRDAAGAWREHRVESTERTHSKGKPTVTSTCSNSVSELFGVLAPGTKLKGSVGQVLARLLSGTRWTAGKCDDFGTVELESWHKSVRECIAELAQLVGGDMVTSVAVGDYGVEGREVRIVRERGGGTVRRQFSWGRNMTDVKRTVGADEVHTAIVGYGAKLDEDSKSDYAARLTVTVRSSADLSRYGVPARGGMAHSFATYTDDACTDAAFLKRQCEKQLAVLSKPLVRYEFDIADVDAELWGDVRLGSRVSCVDDGLGVDMVERVSHIRRTLKGRASCRIAIGERANPLVEKFKASEKTAKAVTGNSSRVAASSPVAAVATQPAADGWVHQVDGVAQAAGVVNFVTSGAPEQPQDEPGRQDEEPEAWGGGGSGEFSSSGGGSF